MYVHVCLQRVIVSVVGHVDIQNVLCQYCVITNNCVVVTAL